MISFFLQLDMGILIDVGNHKMIVTDVRQLCLPRGRLVATITW